MKEIKNIFTIQIITIVLLLVLASHLVDFYGTLTWFDWAYFYLSTNLLLLCIYAGEKALRNVVGNWGVSKLKNRFLLLTGVYSTVAVISAIIGFVSVMGFGLWEMTAVQGMLYMFVFPIICLVLWCALPIEWEMALDQPGNYTLEDGEQYE